VWNYSKYGQKRYNENQPVALSATAAISFTTLSRFGATLAGSSALSVVTAEASLGKSLNLTAPALIKFTQASALVGAGGALLESDSFVSFACYGSLDLGLRIDALLSFSTSGTLAHLSNLAAAPTISVASAASLGINGKLFSLPAPLSISVVAPLRVDIVAAAEPVLLELTTTGRLANTLNVFAVAISAATTAATLGVVKNLAGTIDVASFSATGQLPTVLKADATVQFECIGALRSAPVHNLDGHSIVRVTTAGSFEMDVPLAGAATVLEVFSAADLQRQNDKWLAGHAPLTLAVSNAEVLKDVRFSADVPLQLVSAGTVRMLASLAGAANVSVSQSGALSGAVALNSQPAVTRFSSLGFISTYSLADLLANAGVSEVVVYDVAVDVAVSHITAFVDDGSIAVEAEVFFIDAKEAA
jgi:hypothetical protein